MLLPVILVESLISAFLVLKLIINIVLLLLFFVIFVLVLLETRQMVVRNNGRGSCSSRSICESLIHSLDVEILLLLMLLTLIVPSIILVPTSLKESEQDLRLLA